MRVACPQCTSAYNLDERRIPAAGLNVKCPKCQKTFPVRKPAQPGAAQASTAVPLPAPARPAAAAPPAAPRPPPSVAAPPPSVVAAPPLVAPPPPPVAQPPPAPANVPPAPAVQASAAPPAAPLLDLEGSPAKEQPEPSPAPQARPDTALGFGEVSFDEAAEPPPTVARGEVTFDEAAEPPPAVVRPEEREQSAGLGNEPDLPPEVDAAPPLEAARPPEGAGEPSRGEDPFSAWAPPPPAGPPPPEPPRTAVPPREGEAPGLGPADEEELEMLFGEAAPADRPASAAAPRSAGRAMYRIRRRSGKVFGPFDAPQVVEMLGKGELAGNEDVSRDGEKWSPIGAVSEFADFIRKLNEIPNTPEPGTVGAPGAFQGAAAPPRRGRVATARVAPSRGQRRLVAVLGLLLLAVAGAGVAGQLTGNGLFFQRLLRSRGAGRAGAKFLAEARAAFARDDTASLEQALDLADQALRLDGDDEGAKGVYAQAAGLLAFRGAAAPPVQARARQLASEAAAEKPQALDTLKAAVAVALGGPSDALAQATSALQARAQQGPPDEDAAVLLALAAAWRGDPRSALGWLDRAEAARPGAARLAYARGLLALRRGDDPAARDLFARALAKEPRHLAAALELSAIAERAGDLDRAEALARSVLAPEARALAAPAERARAHLVLAAVARRRPGAAQERIAAATRQLEAAVQEDPASTGARLELASFLVRRGAADKAVALLAAGPSGPSDPESAALQARAMVLSGRVLDASNAVDVARARWPAAAPVTFARGFIQEQLGKPSEAEALYRQAASQDPGKWEPYLALGRLALAANDLARAEASLRLAAEKAPAQAELQVGLGDLELARRAGATAEARYRQALGLDPGLAGAHYGLARVALGRGDEGAAVAELGQALALDPRLAPAAVALATIQWKRGDLAGARKRLEGAVALDPRSALARARLGAVELQSGQADAALAHLEAAVNLDGSLGEARGWLGRALIAKSENVRAVEELRRAVRLEPGSADHHLWLGTALERTNAPGEAEEEYRAGLARDPRRIDGYERLAALRAAQGRCQDGIPELVKALTVAPRQERLRMAIGDCLEKRGRYAEAIRVYRQALKADRSLTALYYKTARAIHESGAARDALAWYERAAREEPRNAMAHYYLGYLYKDRGQKARAVQAFQAYLKLKPDAEDRKDVQAEIEDLGGAGGR